MSPPHFKDGANEHVGRVGPALGIDYYFAMPEDRSDDTPVI